MSKATDDLVDRFAAALKEKLAAAEQKYGYSDEWMRGDWRDYLAEKLQDHVQKGDARDVAAYCAFAWHHGWSITPKPFSLPMPIPGRDFHALPSKAGAHFKSRHKR